jgi:hypothetical protein
MVATGKVTYKPGSILVWQGADGGEDSYTIQRWIAYGGPTAEATATRTINTCKPACANGRHVTFGVTLVLSDRIPCRGVSAYGAMAVRRTTSPRLVAGLVPVRWSEDLAPRCNTTGRAQARSGYYPELGVGARRVLRNAAANAVLVALDPATARAQVRLTCGWYYAPKRRVAPSLWNIDLHGAGFAWESYPSGPASGISHQESRARWERQALLHGWSGTLRFTKQGLSMSDGPTTDICAGVLG